MNMTKRTLHRDPTLTEFGYQRMPAESLKPLSDIQPKRSSKVWIVIVVVALAAVMIAVFAAVQSGNHSGQKASSVPITEKDPLAGKEAEASAESERDSSVGDNLLTDANFEVKEYHCESENGTEYVLIVKNNSDTTAKIRGDLIAKDASGEELASKSCSIDVLGPGEQSVDTGSFGEITGIASVDYDLQYTPETEKIPVLSDLETTLSFNTNNVVAAVTNNGTKSIRSLWTVALFFDSDGNLLGIDDRSATAVNNLLPSNRTVFVQMDAPEAYDHSEVYFKQSYYGTEEEVPSPVTDSDFEIIEYRYLNPVYNETDCYLVITNHSSSKVSIYINAVAKTESGQMIEVDNGFTNVLGPGDQSVGMLFFENTTDIDVIDWQLFYKEEPDKEPDLSGLSYDAEIVDQGVVVNVTNNGDTAANHVKAFAFCFDESGNLNEVVYANYMDDDYEIKPGESYMGLLETQTTPNSADVYLTEGIILVRTPS